MVDQNVKPTCWPGRNSKPGVAKYKPGALESKPVTIKSNSGAMKSKCYPYRERMFINGLSSISGRLGPTRSVQEGPFAPLVLSEKLKHGLSRLAR
jgi:hypothetical protein